MEEDDWASKAKQAESEGYIGTEASIRSLFLTKEPMEFNFKILLVNDIFILLADQGQGGRSVTNDAPQVIKHLDENIPGGIGSRKVYYRDTSGRFDQLRVEDGRFVGLAPCTESQQVKIQEMLDK